MQVRATILRHEVKVHLDLNLMPQEQLLPLYSETAQPLNCNQTHCSALPLYLAVMIKSAFSFFFMGGPNTLLHLMHIVKNLLGLNCVINTSLPNKD